MLNIHIVRIVPLSLFALFYNLDASAVDLEQIYRQALIRDTVTIAAEHALSAVSQKEIQGRSTLLPNIAYKLGGQRSGHAFLNSATEYKIQLKQSLFDVSKWETLHQSQLVVKQGELNYSLAKQDLILRVSKAYFDVLSAQDNLGATSMLRAAIAEQLKLAHRSFDVGSSMITDVKEAEVNFNKVLADEIEAQLDLETAGSRLEEIIGEAPAKLAKVRREVTFLPPEPRNMEKWVSDAKSQNFNVLLQKISVNIAESQVLINRASKYPTVSLVADRGHYYQNNSVGPSFVTSQNYNSFSSSIGVEISIPIFDGYIGSSKVSEAISSVSRAQAEMETVQRRVVTDVKVNYSKVSNGFAKIDAYRTAVDSSQSALSYNKKGYEVGLKANVDILRSQQQLFGAQRDLSRATYDLILSGLRLKAVAGILEDRDLLNINGLLEP